MGFYSEKQVNSAEVRFCVDNTAPFSCVVKLPGLLARTEMPEKNLCALLEQINTFLK